MLESLLAVTEIIECLGVYCSVIRHPSKLPIGYGFIWPVAYSLENCIRYQRYFHHYSFTAAHYADALEVL